MTSLSNSNIEPLQCDVNALGSISSTNRDCFTPEHEHQPSPRNLEAGAT